MSVTVTRDMLVWHDERCGLYKEPKEGYVLVEYTTNYARWMPARQARDFLKIAKERGNYQ